MRPLLCLFIMALPSSPQAIKTIPAPVEAPDVWALKRQIQQLEKENSELNKAVGSLLMIVADHSIKLSGASRTSVTFDPLSPGNYQPIETDAGNLLLSLKKVETQPNGYIVSFEIGNPLNMTFKGFKLKATWGTRLKEDGSNWKEYSSKQKTQEFSFTQDIRTGRWNSFELILPKTTELEYLTLAIDVNVVSLGAATGSPATHRR